MKKSEEILHLLLKNSNDIIVLVNEKGEQFFISNVVADITGYSIEELKGSILDVIHPDDKELIAQHWDRVIADKSRSDTIQYRHKHKEKGYVWFEVVAQNYLDNPSINAVIANVRDISERKKNETLLQESEQKLSKIIEQISDALVIIDSEGVITVWNSGAEVLTGLSSQETVHQKLADIQCKLSMNPINDKNKIEKAIFDLVAFKTPFLFNVLKDYEIVTAKNGIRTIQTLIFPINLGTHYLFGSVSRDITEKNRVQNQLADLNEFKQKTLSNEIDRMQYELEESRKNITIAQLRLMQNMERDSYTIEKIMELQNNTNEENYSKINDLIFSFKQSSYNSNWDEFEILFNNLHSSFYEKLNLKFPNLTVTERKVCAFLRLNMNSKEMMKITFQSEDALKKLRLRLRKKLGIEREVNLNTFLQSL